MFRTKKRSYKITKTFTKPPVQRNGLKNKVRGFKSNDHRQPTSMYSIVVMIINAIEMTIKQMGPGNFFYSFTAVNRV